MDEVYGFDLETAERLKAIAGQPRKLHSQPPYRRRQPTGGDQVKYAYPPAGGIPAATRNATTGVTTPGTANCVLAIEDGSGYKPGTVSVIVENPISVPVGVSGRQITISSANGTHTVLVDDCGSSGPTVDDEGSPGVDSDPLDPLNEV